MLLSEFTEHLSTMQGVSFTLPNQAVVAPHFHITEVGELNRKFIDCGGKIRTQTKINFQLWVDTDIEHRLTSTKLIGVINKAKRSLELPDVEIQIEYQGITIENYGVEKALNGFLLVPTTTACLAPEACLVEPVITNAVCEPNSGCC